MGGGSRNQLIRKNAMSKPFAVVLAGGGARGFAHAGVLKTLEDDGLVPSAIIGVSMGAVVGTTYASRTDWYRALLSIDLSGFPRPPEEAIGDDADAIRRTLGYVQAAWSVLRGWGAPQASLEAGQEVLSYLLGEALLEECRIPVAVCATDLRTGERRVLRTGPAASAVYASSALAGLLPPLPYASGLLADGVYTDVAPVDVARETGVSSVVVVDPGQAAEPGEITNGFQAIMRAMEICHRRHSELRVDSGDLALRPRFATRVDTLDFNRREECVAAGAECARENLPRIRQLVARGQP